MSEHGHPKAVYFLSTVRLWERFSYYGVRAIFVLFLTDISSFNFSDELANNLYAWFIGLVYLTPLIGGYIADRYWGNVRTAIWGSWITVAGTVALAFSATSYSTLTLTIFYISVFLMVLGGGITNPCTTSLVGDFYEPNDPRCDGGFTIFYMGINIGAFLSPIICGWLGERVSWSWGFGSAAIGMLISTLILVLGRKKYLGDRGMCANVPKINVGSSCVPKDDKPLTKEEKQKIAVIFIMAFFTIFFWAAYEQAGSSLTLFAERSTNRMIPFINWVMPASWFQSMNPLFIFLLAPLFSNLWIYLADRKREPSTPAKFVWALVFIAAGFVLMVAAVFFERIYGPVSILWLTGAYFLHTIAELCISPVGLSLVTKLSPVKFASMLMAIWIGSSFFSNLVSGIFAGSYSSMEHGRFFMIPVIVTMASAALLFVIIRPLKRWMHGVH